MTLILIAVPSILTGIVTIIVTLTFKKIKELDIRNEERESRREKYEALVLKNINANGCLAKLTAKCVNGERLNGDLKRAIQHQTEIEHELENHIFDSVVTIHRK